MVIGIIGKVGSGKSLCTKYLKENYNAHILSADDYAKDIMLENNEYLIKDVYEFFSDDVLQEKIRNEIHPLVFKNIKNTLDKILSTEKNSIIAVESALPSEDMFMFCDKMICIKNSYSKKLEILKKTRDYSEKLIKLIYDSQKFYDKYYDMADYTIENDEDKESFKLKLRSVLDEICITCK